MSYTQQHKKLERNVTLLGAFAFVAVAIGGVVEIAPLFWIDNTIEKVDGMRPLHAARAGRPRHLHPRGLLHPLQPDDPAVPRRGRALRALQPRRREHVRPPVPVGLQAHRAGPRTCRRALFDEWHVQHLKDPRAVVPESVMPMYAFLADKDLHVDDAAAALRALRAVGVPYTKRDIEMALADIEGAGRPRRRRRGPRRALSRGAAARLRRRPGPAHRDGCAGRLPADARHAGRRRTAPQRRRTWPRRRADEHAFDLRHAAALRRQLGPAGDADRVRGVRRLAVPPGARATATTTRPRRSSRRTTAMT